ncbi:carbohydrate ABC transporter permease [Streptomyces sp. 110]|uniref:Carbohydrate ABC transporter permease n=1 Tax=Streptomyces endocoffeicus TaxID=2898945 RepID=A0ABS1Q211_9ACTN|nr:carbohydrate ABC transporter permease [Streptomyces endocoffeicus]MBL1118207.1 carbohydrate ABC transporter permease [Streptomyces endocoffeicus]
MFNRPSLTTRIICQIAATGVALPFACVLVAIVATSFDGAGAAANYKAVLTQTPIGRSMLNSAIISLGVVALVYVCTMLAGFAFAKMHFTGKKLVFNAILAGLVLPTIALIVPLFLMVQRIGLFDNYLAVILPLATTIMPFTLLLTKNYLVGIPDEVLEAAKLDGCTSFGTLVRVVLPLSRPITAVVIVWAFLQAWNDFFLPLLFFQDQDMQTVTTIPLYFTSTYGSDEPKIFAALILICLPVVIAYLCLQKFFEKGLSAGAIK